NTQRPQPIDPEDEEKLRSLGYLTSTAEATDQSKQIDPKDEVEVHRMYQDALAALESRNYEFALQRLNYILEEFPQMTDAHFSAGVALAGLGDYDHAIQQYEVSLQLRPDHTMAAYNLASVFEQKGDLASAELWYRKVLAESPNHRFAILRLAELYLRM